MSVCMCVRHSEGQLPLVACIQMGPSGSGKTSLLDILAGRKSTGAISGDIRFQGVAPPKAFLKRHTGYVEQFGAC
jgi:ABC-type multidrug transport system ATPase subunit